MGIVRALRITSRPQHGTPMGPFPAGQACGRVAIFLCSNFGPETIVKTRVPVSGTTLLAISPRVFSLPTNHLRVEGAREYEVHWIGELQVTTNRTVPHERQHKAEDQNVGSVMSYGRLCRHSSFERSPRKLNILIFRSRSSSINVVVISTELHFGCLGVFPR